MLEFAYLLLAGGSARMSQTLRKQRQALRDDDAQPGSGSLLAIPRERYVMAPLGPDPRSCWLHNNSSIVNATGKNATLRLFTKYSVHRSSAVLSRTFVRHRTRESRKIGLSRPGTSSSELSSRHCRWARKLACVCRHPPKDLPSEAGGVRSNQSSAAIRQTLPVRLFHSVQNGSDDAADDPALDGAGGVLAGQVLVDSVGQLGDGKRLQPDSAGAGERSEKKAIPAENHIPDARHGSDLKRNTAFERPDMAGVHAQGFAG